MVLSFQGLRKLTLAVSLAALQIAAPAAAASSPDGPGATAFRTAAEGLPAFARRAWRATVYLETRTWTAGTRERDVSTGSGVILDRDGETGELLIATSSHVVPCDAACVIRVSFPGSRERQQVSVRARRVWHDHGQDLAILRSPAPPDAVFEIARTSTRSPATGGRAAGVLAIGFPDPELYGEPAVERGKRFSAGSLEGAPRPFRSGYRAYASTAVEGRLEPDAALLHTAALLPGSSGGPLIDTHGRVLGINTGSLMPADGAGCVRGEDGRCLQLAIALETVLDRLDEILKRPAGLG